MPMSTDTAAMRGIELLNELVAMKSQQDGVPRSPIGLLGPQEGYDQFAKDVQEVAMLIFAAQQAIPVMERLATIGRTLEARGDIALEYSESYATAALDHLQSLSAAA